MVSADFLRNVPIIRYLHLSTTTHTFFVFYSLDWMHCINYGRIKLYVYHKRYCTLHLSASHCDSYILKIFTLYSTMYMYIAVRINCLLRLHEMFFVVANSMHPAQTPPLPLYHHRASPPPSPSSRRVWSVGHLTRRRRRPGCWWKSSVLPHLRHSPPARYASIWYRHFQIFKLKARTNVLV